MIAPRKIKYAAGKKENENLRFRAFLKENADEKELDQQFQNLHRELFAVYDCSRCRNCCKMYQGFIPREDLERDSEYLGMTVEMFIRLYLEPDEREEGYCTLHNPCDFLQENGDCLLGDCRPENCRKYPYTDQPERLQSMYSILEAAEVCPVVYEILERLKDMYGFPKR